MRGVFLLLWILLIVQIQAQNVCNGIPGTNTIVPSTQTICSGNSAVMALAGTYSNTGYTYQWKASPASISGPYTTVIGATSPTFNTGPTFTTSASTHSIFYQAIITCTSSGQSITLTSTLYILPCTTPCSGTPAANVVVPSSGSICTGAVPALSLTTTNTLTGLSYQWSTATAASGPYTAVSGATQAAYAGSTLNTGVYYYKVVTTCTNSGLTNSAIATVTVNPCHTCFGTPGTNTIVTASPTICAGSSPIFSLANTYSNTGYSYQWFSSTISNVGPYSAISGATLNTYTSTPVTGTKYYMVAITCTLSGQTFSTNSMIQVSTCATPCSGAPANASILPLTHTVCMDQLPTLSLSTSYTSSGISYQWKYGTNASGPFTSITNATLASYTGSASPVNGFYQCVITCSNSGQSTTLNHSVAVVNCTYCAGPPFSNTVIPSIYTVCVGSSPTLNLLNTYTASGYTYQWQASTVSAVGPFNSVSGAISPTLNYTPILQNTHFNIIITCTNSGNVFNAYRTVSLVPCSGMCTAAPRTCEVVASRTAVCINETASISMALSQTYTDTGISFQWMSSTVATGPFTNIIGATAATYTALFYNMTTYYAVAITCSNSGLTFTNQTSVQLKSCVGLESTINLESVRIRVDANHQQIEIELPPYLSESEIIFVNSSGNTLATIPCRAGGCQVPIDLKWNGVVIYVIKAKDGSVVKRGKLMVNYQD